METGSDTVLGDRRFIGKNHMYAAKLCDSVTKGAVNDLTG